METLKTEIAIGYIFWNNMLCPKLKKTKQMTISFHIDFDISRYLYLWFKKILFYNCKFLSFKKSITYIVINTLIKVQSYFRINAITLYIQKEYVLGNLVKGN